MSITVVKPGALLTVQDLGRPNARALGVPPSGAFDRFALRAANALVGNPDHAAALEITMRGPTLAFERDAVIAIAGAVMEADLDGSEIPRLRAIRVSAGATLRLGRALAGVRAVVAVRGGIDAALVLGSRSTLAAAGIGRALVAGDRVRVGSGPPVPMRRLPHDALRLRADTVRVIAGPQDGPDLTGREYTVSTRADRSGVRLDGAPVPLERADLDPEGVVVGAIQVPGDGLPIVLGPDGPATGGYAKPATVASVDLPLIAQARPGDTLRFVTVGVDEARAAWRERIRVLSEALEVLA